MMMHMSSRCVTRMNKLNDGWGGQNTRKKKSRARQIHADLFFFWAGRNLGVPGRNLGSVGRNLGSVGRNLGCLGRNSTLLGQNSFNTGSFMINISVCVSREGKLGSKY